jgi:hypothetical protein
MILKKSSKTTTTIFKHYFLIFLILLLDFSAVKAQQNNNLRGLQIAFLSDVHLQDLFGSFSDNEFKGILNPKTGKYILMRTMASQLSSTRIFNENYFAFIAALDDIAKRKIKYVALPGDYTDDGQPIHVKGLSKILIAYQEKYGIEFFITTGNHDPVGPFAQDSGKNDFLGNEGKNQAVYSKSGLYLTDLEKENVLVVTSDISKMGYLGITNELQDFGFYPNKKNKFWATPFSTYTTKNYTYSKAKSAALLTSRLYNVAPGFEIPDVSYVVEPIDGLWLLAIDGNVYIPKKNKEANSKQSKDYSGASTGYNNVVSHKKHLLKWIEKITQAAKKQRKTVIAFSHFPMIDFNDDASPEIKELLGPDKWQLNRLPREKVAEAFADAGLKIHFGGHMHINDTGIRKTERGNTLVNIQTPSLAAYIPAYKLLTIQPNSIIDVQTITIDKVPRYNELFELYKMEHQFLESQDTKNIWNVGILKTKNYHEFTDFHLKELVRLRFLADWPEAFKNFILSVTAEDLLVLSQIKSKNDLDIVFLNKEKFSKQWEEGKQAASKIAEANNLDFSSFKECSGTDFFIDFYRLRSADKLALKDIGLERMKQYRVLTQLFLENEDVNKPLRNQIQLFLKIFDRFSKGAPANHFSIDLKSGEIHDLSR